MSDSWIFMSLTKVSSTSRLPRGPYRLPHPPLRSFFTRFPYNSAPNTLLFVAGPLVYNSPSIIPSSFQGRLWNYGCLCPPHAFSYVGPFPTFPNIKRACGEGHKDNKPKYKQGPRYVVLYFGSLSVSLFSSTLILRYAPQRPIKIHKDQKTARYRYLFPSFCLCFPFD